MDPTLDTEQPITTDTAPAPEQSDVTEAASPDQNPDLKDLKRWRQRVKRARKLRSDWEKDFDIETGENFYLGKHWENSKPGEKAINHFLATIRVTLPGLLYDQPSFMCRPKPGSANPATANGTKYHEGILNSVAGQDDNLRTASRLGLLQNFFRIGVLKVVYDPKLVPNPRAGEPIYRRDANSNIMVDPATATQIQEIDPETGMPMVEQPEILDDETYRFEWVDARKMLLPDEGPDMNAWPYLMQEVEVYLEDAKADDRFSPTAREKMKPDSGEPDDENGKKSSYEDDTTSDDDTSDPDPIFRYIEAWDLRKNEYLCFTEGNRINEFLARSPTPPGIEGHPYAILPGWFPMIGPKPSPWPLPYTSPWIELQKEYNITRQQQIEGGKRSARKIYYDDGTFEDEEQARLALKSSVDMEAVKLNSVKNPPVTLVDPDLNPAIYKSSASLMMDWRLVTGQTGEKMGIADSDTATEANIVAQASNMRDADLSKDVNNWLKTAGKKMLQLIKATLTLDMFVRLRGMDDQAVSLYLMSVYGIPPQMAEMFPELKTIIIQRYGQLNMQRITQEELIDEVDVDVMPGSTRPPTLAAERRQWLEFLTIIANNPQIALSKLLLEETARKFESINQQVVDELHAIAVIMVQAKQQTAGHGGEGATDENSKDSAKSKSNGAKGGSAE